MELALSLLESSSRAALTTDSIMSVMDVLLGFETKAVLDTDGFFCSDDTSTPVTVMFQHKSNRNMTSNIQRDKRNTGHWMLMVPYIVVMSMFN
jgi:hypothetical protein